MSKTRVSEAPGRLARLIPFDAGILRAEGAYVCTPVQTVPAELREAQGRRTAHYMSDSDPMTARILPGDGPRYYVTSGGQLVAWVTLDGQTHYVDGLTGTAARHAAMVRAAWPARFAAGE